MKWKHVKYIAFGLIGVFLLLIIWGAVIEPRLIDFKEETAIVPNLLPDLVGKLGVGDCAYIVCRRHHARRVAACFVGRTAV